MTGHSVTFFFRVHLTAGYIHNTKYKICQISLIIKPVKELKYATTKTTNRRQTLLVIDFFKFVVLEETSVTLKRTVLLVRAFCSVAHHPPSHLLSISNLLLFASSKSCASSLFSSKLLNLLCIIKSRNGTAGLEGLCPCLIITTSLLGACVFPFLNWFLLYNKYSSLMSFWQLG